MKKLLIENKQFEATVVVICLTIVAFILGLSLVFNEERKEETNEGNRIICRNRGL